MHNPLIQFWSRSRFPIRTEALNVHPDDLEWFREKGCNVQKRPVMSFDRYIRGKHFGIGDKQLHLSLLPLPFIGNLENATIFILLMNPGFSAADYFAEENPAFRAACIRNLNQSNGKDKFPFFYLNPQFAWSGGFMWWEARLRPILLKLMETRKFSTYSQALAFLAKKIAVVELAPYHSVVGSALKGPWENLPSAVVARQFVKEQCQSPKQPLIVVARSHEKWGISGQGKPNIIVCPPTRGITFNPELPKEKSGKAGQKILEHLGYPTLIR